MKISLLTKFLAAGLMLCAPCAAESQTRTVTFARDIAPIIWSRCASCHREGGDAPFSLTSFEEVRRRAATIAAVTERRYMPPWKPEPGPPDFVQTRRLTATEIARIGAWVKGGAPLGDARDLPAPPAPLSTWPAGPPDLVVPLEEYALAADGPDVFRNFVVSVPITAARFVRGLQLRPGNAAVHHANIRVDRTPASRDLDVRDPGPGYEGLILRSADYPDGQFLGWTPGQITPVLNDELAWRLEPHSDLVVQLHLRRTGKPERIKPMIGLYFGNAAPARPPSMMRLGKQTLDIPAGANAFVSGDSFDLPVAVDVRAIQPHAHFRARTLNVWAVRPDGSKQSLLQIRDWDINWQDKYTYATPVHLPAGTRLVSEFTFDNSEANVRNPDRPAQRVGWGWRSADEMADVWLQVTAASDADRQRFDRDAHRRMLTEDALGCEVLLAREPTHINLRNDAAMIYMTLGRPADALTHFAAVTRLQPTAAAFYNEGVALDALKRRSEAAAKYIEALRVDPNHSGSHNNLAAIRLSEGRVDEARQGFERAVSSDPLNAEARANLGLVLQGTGRADEALAQIRESLRLEPDRIATLAPFVLLLAAHPDAANRRPAEAVALGERVVSALSRHDAVALDALAAGLAALGKFDDALQVATEAANLPGTAEALRAAIQARSVLYRNRTAFVLP